MPHSERTPNLLLIVADDLGWSDLGAFGGEIDTPHLDALVARGQRWSNFHASPVCSTTRAMLMTGCDHHEVGLGNLVELMTPEQQGKPGYEGYLNGRAATVAQRLRAGGYLTTMSGKWHLGVGGESPPDRAGFERSFALLQGEHNHFGHDQTAGNAGFHGVSQYRRDGRPTAYPVGAYSSDVFADEMIGFIDEARDDTRPWFGYLAFTAPHCPLQAPRHLVDRYRGRYDAGPAALRASRLERMRGLGLSTAEAVPAEIRGLTPWEDLPEADRRLESRKMEIYAAMVEAMDAAIGRVLAALERTGRLADTTIVFLSDNGPSGTLREELPGWRDWIQAHADNRLANLGEANSYVSIGPSWAQAQAAPFSLFKRYTTEGGIRTCALACGPGIQQRTENPAFLHVMDLAPTLLEWANIDSAPPPGRIAMRGSSAAGLLNGTAHELHGDAHAMAWELAYGRAIRRGPWKAVYLPVGVRKIAAEIPVRQWQLFHTASDPGETRDLAEQEPGTLRELVAAWHAYAQEVGVVLEPGAAE